MEFSANAWRVGALFCILVISGCGGGGGGSDSDDIASDSPSLNEGVFLDSPVEGLQYLLNDEKRVTDENGTFLYADGASVRFKIGNIELGVTQGDSIITPIDLVPAAEDETAPAVINLLRFLQTLDDDGNPENGITITEVIRNLAQNRSVDFNQSQQQFEASVQSLINELTAATAAGARNLIAAEVAVDHFRGTLADINNGNAPTPTPDGDVLSAEQIVEFFYSRGAGVWRSESRTSYQTRVSTTFPAIGDNPEVEVTSDQGFAAFSRMVLRSSGNLREVDYCSTEGLVRDTTLNTDQPIFEPEVCQSETVEYVRLSDRSFAFRGYCEGELWHESIFEKLSSGPDFDNGSFTLNSAEIPDANAQQNVCGMIVDGSTTTSNVSPDPNPSGLENGVEEFWTIRVVAPYEETRLAMNISLLGQSQQPGVYPIFNAGSGPDTVYSLVSFSSSAFDASLASPAVTGGSVTINSVSDRRVAGSYNLTTSTGNLLTGTFEVDLN